MLFRIEQIQGIGLLHSANGKNFKCEKATFIYADNGRGKSTLASVLRSVSTGDTTLITKRKTVDGTLPPSTTLQFDSGHKVTFSKDCWSEIRPEILVFDSEFIERNVHSGGAVSTGHRKNLLEFALGEAAVNARKSVEQSTNTATLASNTVTGIESQLKGYHTGLTLAQFEKLTEVQDADTQIDALRNSIKSASNIEKLLAKAVPRLIPLPSFDIEGLFSVLSITLADIHNNAEQVVKQHIQRLNVSHAEGWLSQGCHLGDKKTCPYCAQDITGNNLIQAYQTYFNASYNQLKNSVEFLHTSVVEELGIKIIDDFTQSVALIKAQVDSWNDHIIIQPINFDESTARSVCDELRKYVFELIRRKQASPAEYSGSLADSEKVTELWQKVIALMQLTNEQIKTVREMIEEYKGKLAKDNVQLLQQKVQLLNSSKRRYEPAVLDLISKLDIARCNLKEAEKTKKAERGKLDALMKTTLKRYETSINTLLNKFGASFSIRGMGANFLGGAPRSEYGLLLRGRDVPLEGGSPSFATTLSEGDRRTLAFAFFIASAFGDANLARRIVIVDDPMCSLDLNRKHHTKLVLKKLHSKAEQLIVLAHDPYFIRDIRDTLIKENSSTPISIFQLRAAQENYTDFDKFDVDKECESAYFQHHRLLNEFADGSNADNRSVAKAIRPMLEGYLHRRFPNLIPKALTFGQVVSMIKSAPSSSPLCHAHNLVDELNDINDYAGQFHHDTNPGNADTVTVISTELKTCVEYSLHLVHSGTTRS
ncbi:MAG: AAA family ATPase [Methyloglobulus sp.]|nr:AAA family ATPase [Methyloglobulus sp.]